MVGSGLPASSDSVSEPTADWSAVFRSHQELSFDGKPLVFSGPSPRPARREFRTRLYICICGCGLSTASTDRLVFDKILRVSSCLGGGFCFYALNRQDAKKRSHVSMKAVEVSQGTSPKAGE